MSKIVLVTGGARGIGLGIVHAFAAAGHRVMIADLGHTDADPTAAWELAKALANFSWALCRMIVTDRSSQCLSFLFCQHHVYLALKDTQ